MKPNLYFTEEEFIKFIEENVSDDDIRMMFENANLEKDEQLLLNNDDYEEFSTKNRYTLDVKNTFENSKDVSFNENSEDISLNKNSKDRSFKLGRPIRPYRYTGKFVA